MKKNKLNNRFRKLSVKVSNAVGSPWAFMAAIALILGWLATGSYFQWSTGHSLFINSFTTIITFCLIFVIQGSQNRDSRAIQVKLNAIIVALEGANNKMAGLEEAAEEELDEAVEEIKQHIEEDS